MRCKACDNILPVTSKHDFCYDCLYWIQEDVVPDIENLKCDNKYWCSDDEWEDA